jgi:hypothetical protein
VFRSVGRQPFPYQVMEGLPVNWNPNPDAPGVERYRLFTSTAQIISAIMCGHEYLSKTESTVISCGINALLNGKWGL